MRTNTTPQQKCFLCSSDYRACSKRPAGGGAIHNFDCIISRSNLYTAWREFIRGKKYKKDVSDFSLRLDYNLRQLYFSLKNRTYSHGSYIPFKINDPKPRDIHKAQVRDRVVHHLLYTALYPYFDTKFIYDSYSCRVGKGTHKARERFKLFYNKCSKNKTKQVWVLKCDIKKFFANIDHVTLKNILRRHITDTDVCMLLENIIDSFHTNTQPTSWRTSSIGLPLGNLTSQLLVNVYMNEFDQYMKHVLKVRYYIRYADDFVVLSQDKEYLETMLVAMSSFLSDVLQLTLHPKKVSITTYSSGIDFLGVVHFPYHRVLRTKTKQRMIKRLGQSDSPGTVASYKGLLKHVDSYGLAQKLF